MDKDKIAELAREADVWVAGQPPYQEQLERFAALIEAEVRGDTQPVTVLPDGSAFAVMSFPLPKDHWLYAERQYRDGEYEPIELGKPILTHEMHDAVVSAVRYAVRGATNCGKEVDFDPDALVQNAVYALCGPYGTLTPKQEQSSTPVVDSEPVAWMTFDGEGSYELRLYDENEDYADQWDKRNPNHKGWVTPLYLHSTSEITDQLMLIIDLYEKALLTTFPQGASNEVFEYWNKARKELSKIKSKIKGIR